MNAHLDTVTISSVGTACEEGLDCLILVHNERRIIEEFFRYYRLLGVTRFLVVDDRSTDGCSEWLRAQPDALVFTPVDGTQYKTHKKKWRSEILDAFCHEAWVLVPDADEWFVYKDMETVPLPAMIAKLEAEGARALPAIMVDMYRDSPLNEHVYNGGSLLEAFPLFDSQGYYELTAPSAFVKKYPCPDFMYTGGMRHRLFMTCMISGRPLALQIFSRVCSMPPPVSARVSTNRGTLRRLLGALVKKVAARYCYGHKVKNLYNCTKLPLVKWVRGLHFNGGAHALSGRLPLSSRRCALLHFKFAGGVGQLTYIAQRGSHADGSVHYHRLLASPELAENPVCSHSRRYTSSASLGELIS